MIDKCEIRSDVVFHSNSAYAPAVQIGDFIYVSGQSPVTRSGELVEPKSIECQTDQVLRNLSHVLAVSGASMTHIVKLTVFLQDLKHFAGMDATCLQWFTHPLPARSTVRADLIDKRYLVEIEAVAVLRPNKVPSMMC